MTKKGWTDNEGADVVWKGLHILLKAIRGLTADEILSRVEERVDDYLIINSDGFDTKVGGFYLEGGIYLEEDMFRPVIVTHELLHAVSDFKESYEIEGLPGHSYRPAGISLFVLNDNRGMGLIEFKGMPAELIGGRFNEGYI